MADFGSGLGQVVAVLQSIAQNLGSLIKTISTTFTQLSTTATSATAGSATALPSQPAGYFVFTNPQTGNQVKIPYYNP